MTFNIMSFFLKIPNLREENKLVKEKLSSKSFSAKDGSLESDTRFLFLRSEKMEEEFILVTKKNKRKKIPCDTKITQDCKIHGRNEEPEDDNEYYEKSISRIITCRCIK